MEIVGSRFATGEYFIPDLVYSGDILKLITDMVKPKLAETASEAKRLGKVVIGTVIGDIHDIGKNLVVFFLDINGFDVVDLGVDVSPEKFVNAVRESGAPVVGLSGFLTLSFDGMKATVDALKDAGLRDSIKVMVGGGQIDERIRGYTGADACGDNALEAVLIAKQWIGG
jgi:methanogenic corrinoid protein MtbC1